MKIQFREFVSQGMGGGHWRVKVVEVPDGESVPDGGKKVADGTPASDWHMEPAAQTPQADPLHGFDGKGE